MREKIVFFLNGQRQEIGPEHAGVMLADYLRISRGLTGTKVVCAEGDCGACTVLRYQALTMGRPSASGPLFLPVNSCVMTMAQVDATSLVTVDALAEPELTPVQKAMVDCHGSQCGFCTPGFVMALTGLVEKRLCSKTPLNGPIEPQEARNALTGNLCRCTGYQPILDAATAIPLKQCTPVRNRFLTQAHQRELRSVARKPLFLRSDNFTLFAPVRLREAAHYLRKHKDARLISGGTDLGVLHNKRKIRLSNLVSLHLVPELHSIQILKGSRGKPTRISVGARASLSDLRLQVEGLVPELSRFLDLFASPQIKNIATLAGNVGNASPIGDTPPFLLVANAVVRAFGPSGSRAIPITKFFVGYRKTALKAGESIVAIEFDAPAKDEKLVLYKSSQRKDLDISTVNAAFRMMVRRGKIESIAIAMGGVAATPVRLHRTEKALLGAELDPSAAEHAVAALREELSPISDLRGSAAFRRVITENLLEKFLREAAAQGGEA